MDAFVMEEVHKSFIESGDTILHNGQATTVSKKDITRTEFFGISLFGDSYMCGYQTVKRLKLNNHHLRKKNENSSS